jgi:pimeloyl-ACP methyl ester carboxylesterase
MYRAGRSAGSISLSADPMANPAPDDPSFRRDRRVAVADAGAFCLDRGRPDAPAVLLIHGLGSICYEIFTALGPPLLSAGLRVVAIDRPGYGGSDLLGGPKMGPAAQAEWLAGVLKGLDLKPAAIVAHSFGAAVALWLADTLEGPTPPLVLVNPFCRPTPAAAAPLMRLSIAPAVGPVLRRNLIPVIAAPLVHSLLANACAPDPVPAALEALSPAVLTQESAILAMTRELRDYNGDAERLARPRHRARSDCTARVLALSGARDRVIAGKAHGEWLRARGPATEHRCLDTGHMLHHARPRVVVDAVERLVAAGP